MSDGEASRWQRRLREEFNDTRLLVRWDHDIERYQIGYVPKGGLTDDPEWFYTVTDGHSGFRPLDQRIVRKLHTLDKTKQPNWTGIRLRKHIEQENLTAQEKQSAETRYQMMHEIKFRKARFWEAT
jgi:hypothetical protein